MADETIILKVEVDNSDVITKLEKNKLAILQLKEEQSKLTKAYKDGQVTAKEYASESVRLEQLTKTHTKAYGELTHQLQGTKSWTDKLKDSMSANSGAADKLTGGLAGTATSIVGMTKASIAFIATPIGAVVAALGAALGALTAYLKGSEEGQDKLAKAMAIGKVVFEGLIQVAEKLGEVLFAAIEFIGDAAMKVIEFVNPALAATMEEARRAGAEIADLQDQIEAEENHFIVQRAVVNKKVSELRERAIKEEGDQKRKTIEEAIKLEKDLADAETEHANKKLQLLYKEQATTGALTEEQKKARAEAQAEVINQAAQGAAATIKFQKELEKLNDGIAKEEIAAANLAAAKIRAQQDDVDNTLATEGIKQQAFIATGKIQKDLLDGNINAALVKKDLSEKEKKQTQDITKIQKLESDARLANLSNTLGQGLNLLDKESEAYKAIATAKAIMDTYRAADYALANPPGPPWSFITAGVTIATGLANVAKINGAFAGGGSFFTKGPQMIMVGDNPGGVERVDVTPISGKGRTIYDGNMIAMAGGGTVFSDGGLNTNMGTSAVNQQMMLANIMKNLPPIYASWTEGQRVGNSIAMKENLASA